MSIYFRACYLIATSALAVSVCFIEPHSTVSELLVLLNGIVLGVLLMLAVSS